ncbi:cytochrome P450 [Mycena amicta]|nr:cytochrome P450 [Mycena amicta]
MSLELTSSLLAAAVAVVLCVNLARKDSRRPPPGPAALPIVGNLFDLPVHEPWKVYQDWSARYGSDVIHMKVFGTDILVVNSAKAASDLFGHKSALYSDSRPRMPMIQEVIGLGWHFGFMPYGPGPYGDLWRQHRRIFAQHSSAFSTEQQLKWTKIFLVNLLTSPDDFMEHAQHFAAGSSLEVTFGLQVQPSGNPDPFIGAAKQVVQSMTEAGLFGTYMVDFLPFLKYIPFLPFKRQAKEWRTASDIAAHVPWDLMTKAAESGVSSPSVASELLASGDLDQTSSRQAIAAMFASGSAATVSALTSFILAMTLYPDVQRAAQEEIDSVVQGRLPGLSDEPKLPYVTAIIREVGRWNPVVPLAFPHSLSSDDIYNGYHLPAGSVVLPNSWAILHDPAVYPEPETFKPSRFLTQDGKLNPLVKDSEVWGYGRRACPGRKVAESELFLAFASVLTSFNIAPATSESGQILIPNGEYGSGMLRRKKLTFARYPKPFKCSIRPRSKEVVQLLQ